MGYQYFSPPSLSALVLIGRSASVPSCNLLRIHPQDDVYYKALFSSQSSTIRCKEGSKKFTKSQLKMTKDFKQHLQQTEVVSMEWLLEEVLNFECFLLTIYNFLWFYLKVARENEEVEKTTKYLAMLALRGCEQLCYWPSIFAALLVVLASLVSHHDEFCDLAMQDVGNGQSSLTLGEHVSIICVSIQF